MTKVCRLCLARLQRGSKYFNINAVESFTGFMPYRDQLTTCIPEMALDLIPNPVICNNCRNALKSSYDFKSRCLLVERKIRQYVESQPPDTTVYNLTEIDTSSLPKPANNKFEVELLKEPPKLLPLTPKVEVQKVSSHPSSILSNLLSVREEVILPNPSEIEITNVKFVPAIRKVRSPSKIARKPLQITYAPIEKDEHGLYTCNHCDKKFPNVPSLHTHKTRVHEEDYICNFCNVPFKTLQNLRKHNQLCQKARAAAPAPSQSVLTKRPHLPTKAKNHLKRWLFNHTDHPYPTDVEKQQLMKETNLSLLQVENWFINARRRILADLTRLKNMRGGLFRGRRAGRGRGRSRIDISSLEEDIFDDDSETMFEEDGQDETISASRLLKDLEQQELESEGVEPAAETSGETNEEEMSEKDDDEQDIKPLPIEIIPEKPIDLPMDGSENTDEEDPLENTPLSILTSNIKMEIDIDER